jgi:hypothetical protein
MPLVQFDLVEGRSANQVKAALLNATHSALAAAFRIPERDRYQTVREHPASHFLMEVRGLGSREPRTGSLYRSRRAHDRAGQGSIYHLVCESLEKECGIQPSDVVVCR